MILGKIRKISLSCSLPVDSAVLQSKTICATILVHLQKRWNRSGMSAFYNILNDYWLWKEVYTKLGVSNPTYRYWDRCEYIKLGPRYVFIKRHTLPDKHQWVEESLTNLDGYLPTQYASNMLNADSHLFNYKRMSLYNTFEYKFVNQIKFDRHINQIEFDR